MHASTPMRGGIDLGGTKIQAAIVRPGGEVLAEARRPTPTDGGPPEVAEQMAVALSEAADEAEIETDSLVGVGVGAPGDVEARSGELSNATNLPHWHDAYALAPDLSDRLGAPVRLGNDVDVATAAEFKLGAGREYSSFIGVFWGTGVGAGLILDGRRWVGRGAAGEIGHMVVEVGGKRCPCGNRGCMEAYAGRKAMEATARHEHEKGRKTDLFKIMHKRGRDRLTSSVWARALDHEDELATELIDGAVNALGAAIASAINLLDLEAVILGGGLGLRLGDTHADRLRERIGRNLFDSEHPPPLHLAELGDLGGAIGASLLFDEA